jgi:hypothetical protein
VYFDPQHPNASQNTQHLPDSPNTKTQAHFNPTTTDPLHPKSSLDFCVTSPKLTIQFTELKQHCNHDADPNPANPLKVGSKH